MTLSIKNGGYVVLIRLDLMFSNWSSFHNDIKLVRIRLVFNSFKIKDYFSYKDPVPNDLDLSLHINLLVPVVVLAILAKLAVILKLRLRSISKRIIGLTFLKIKEALHINCRKPNLNAQQNHLALAFSL